MAGVVLDRVRPEIVALTLSRPERLNALDFPLVREISEALTEIDLDNSCRAVVLTGAGRAFCSGLDLKSISGSHVSAGLPSGPRAGMRSQAHIAGLVPQLQRLTQPVVAAVNGAAFGGGFALASACDLRVVSRDARLCTQFLKVGVSGCDLGISYTLPRLIGGSRATDLILTARELDADEAERIGWANRVVEPEQVVEAAIAAAEAICAHSPFGVVMTKEVLAANRDAPSVEAAIALENRTQILAGTTGEVFEAAAAFAERRAPKWTS